MLLLALVCKFDCNLCSLTLRYFPSAWKRANVILILKSGKKNDGNPQSYRPISLLSNVGKVFERLIMYKLDDLGFKNWISRNQFGFMKGRSTLDAIDNLVTNLGNKQAT